MMKIIIVAALFCEAAPLIQYYGLKKTEISQFPVYQANDLTCIISGIGKINAAAAVGFIGGLHLSSAWLNLGIAGHRNLPLGEGVVAHKIVDPTIGKNLYPTMHPRFPKSRSTIITVDQPETIYHEDALYDMEAYGFARAALRFSCAELVQSYKLVSDNAESEKKQITAEFVKAMIEEKLKEIDSLISTMRQTVQQITPSHSISEMFASIVEKARFSKTQKHQLETLLIKWNALGFNEFDIPSGKDASEILLFLKTYLNQAKHAL